MKNTILVFIAMTTAVSFTSCIKHTDPPAQILTFKIGNGSVQTADAPWYISLFGIASINGAKGTISFFMSMNSTSPGTYSKLNGTGGFGLTIGGTQYVDLSSSVTITSNDNRRLTGNYTAEMSIINVDTVIITGSFANIAF